MASRKVSPIDGTATFVVFALVLVPSVLLNPTFKATFTKKCMEYEKKNDKTACEKMWATFEKAYVGKDSKDVTPANYEQLFKDFPFTHPCDKTMWWSGINRQPGQDIVHEFTAKKKSYFCIEDTWLGHTLDHLTWCGKKNSKETFTDCFEENLIPFISFWEKASEKSGKHACGEVIVMLDGGHDQPFYDQSVLATTEIPNMTSEVKKLMVVVLVEKNENQCNKQSLKDLKGMLKKKNIDYGCKEVTKTDFRNCINDEKCITAW